MDPATVNRNELTQLREDTAAEMIKIGYISSDIYQRTRSLVDDFRNNNPDLYSAGSPGIVVDHRPITEDRDSAP